MEAITGNAGWFGAGLFGAMLMWFLFVHLPGRDKRESQLIADFRTELGAARAQALKALADTVAEFRAELVRERELFMGLIQKRQE